MSLLTQAQETCTPIIKATVSDGMGGKVTTWADGTSFSAAVQKDNSIEARIAEKSGVTDVYTIYTSRDTVLAYHDVFRRESDGKIFRVTSDGDEEYTPPSATLDLRCCRAEEWSIPS